MSFQEAAMYSKEVADAICARLSEGESLRKASAAEGVSPVSVLRWLEADAQFAEQYAQARARGYQLLADEIIEISDDASGDVKITDRGAAMDYEFVARSKLRVDSRKWMLSKMLPKVYGDKSTTVVANEEGKSFKIDGARELTREEVEQELARRGLIGAPVRHGSNPTPS